MTSNHWNVRFLITENFNKFYQVEAIYSKSFQNRILIRFYKKLWIYLFIIILRILETQYFQLINTEVDSLNLISELKINERILCPIAMILFISLIYVYNNWQQFKCLEYCRSLWIASHWDSQYRK